VPCNLRREAACKVTAVRQPQPMSKKMGYVTEAKAGELMELTT